MEFQVDERALEAFRNKPMTEAEARRAIRSAQRQSGTAPNGTAPMAIIGQPGPRAPVVDDGGEDSDGDGGGDGGGGEGYAAGDMVDYVSIEHTANCQDEASERTYDDDQEFSRDGDPYCYLCSVSDNVNEQTESGEAHRALMRLISASFRGTSKRGLARSVQKHYNKRLKMWTRDRKPWRQRMIIAHITRHAPTPTTMIMDDLDALHAMTCTLKKNGLMTRVGTDGPGKYRVDADNAKLYTLLLRSKMSCIRLLPEMAKD